MIMHDALKYFLLSIVILLSTSVSAQNSAFLRQLEERDSILIADQLMYGFEINQLEEGTVLGYPELKDTLMQGVPVLTPWIVDTIKVTRQKKGMPRLLDIRSGVVITSFDEGVYHLPPLSVRRQSKDGVVDTLVFEPLQMDIRTMPVDTTTFKPHDIKAQIRYPLTMDELIPYVASVWVLAVVLIVAVCLIIIYRRKDDPAYMRRDPAHIVALRKLDKYRGNKMWADDKQKLFYSGVTDTLREYIASRYGISAMEMTTKEIFDLMKDKDAPDDLLIQLKELFERADFVKFAKHIASEEENASTLPLAVRFVTQTYQEELESESEDAEADKK